MKKYLMIGFAAIAFASCSNHDFETMSQEEIVKAEYDAKFIATFGQPSRSQTWGFGASTRAFTRSGNTSGSYTPWPATHEYKDASGKVVAGANMNHNQWGSSDLQSMPFGGWIVPDPLTPGQKERVKAYFQANPNLGHQDPQYANFFVQQVYTGGTDAPETGNKESTKAADGTPYNALNMNQLTVGEANSHINDFNAGTCTSSEVLYNDGTTDSDQITLMVNVDDTSCFGYHDTGGSNVKGKINHNDKWALVSAATIDEWAAANGNPGEAVTDKWNRSFMGFDHELLPESDLVTDDYALLSQVPNLNNIPYAWDGEKVMIIGAVPESTETTKNDDFDLMPYFANHVSGNNATCSTENGKIVCTFGQYYGSLTFGQGTQDWTPYSKLVIEFETSTISGTVMDIPFSVGDTKVEVPLNDVKWYGDDQGPTIVSQDGTPSQNGTLTITSVKLIGKTIEGQTYDPSDYYNPTYLLGDADADKIAFYSTNTNMYGGTILDLTEDEMKTTQDGKTCLNLVKFRQLKNDGYHPISTDLKTWVKWEAACDGYYSDWIVTLTKAERITPPDDYTPDYQGRIMAEDLTANNDPTGKKSDWDFNDVVFDWDIHDGKAYIKLWAAGGTLPLTIGGELNAEGTEVVGGVEVHGKFGVSTNTMVNTGLAEREAKEFVLNDGITYTNGDANAIKLYVKKNGQWIEITAEQGKPAGKFNCEVGTEWCDEYVDIRRVYPQFAAWVTNEKVNWATLETGRAVLTDENLENNDVYPLE